MCCYSRFEISVEVVIAFILIVAHSETLLIFM